MTQTKQHVGFLKIAGTVGVGLLLFWAGTKVPGGSLKLPPALPIPMTSPTPTTSPSKPRLDVVNLETVFHVIRQVETGSHPDPANAVGDQGRSLGPFQISCAYFQDAIDNDSSLYGLEYEGVRDERLAKIIMLSYFERWVPTPWTLENLCRTHNGGPQGRFRDSTLPYWEKCLEVLGR